MKFGLDDKKRIKINEVFACYPQIEEVILFGSRAKGNYKPGSDIDITLKGKGINLELLNAVSGKLDDLLLPYTFDISIFSHISNNELIYHINRVGQPLFKREMDMLHL